MNKIKKALLALPLVVLLFGCKKIGYEKTTKPDTTVTTKDNTTIDNPVDDTVTYHITYELNGGKNNSLNPVTFTEGTKVSLEDATKEGYDFVGWSTNQAGTSFVSEIDLDIDWTIYAIFTPHKYNINYHNVDKLNNSNPTTYTISDKNITLSSINASHIDFKGWYTTSTFDSDSLITVINTSSLKNYDLYAKYDIIKEYPECIVLANNPTFDGETKQLVSATVTGGTLSFSLDGINYSEEIPTAINAGTYTVYYKVTGDETHLDIENSIDVTINQANYELEGITFNNGSKVYNGEAQSLVINGDLPNGVTVSYEGSGINVGEYEIIANFTIDDSNYTITPMKAILTITKATYSGIVFDNGSKVYNGNAQQLEVTNLPSGLTVEYSGFGINVGEYEITAIFTNNDSNYNDVDSITRTLTITKATYDINVTFENKTFEYDGLYHDLVISGNIPEGLTVSYDDNHKKDVGEYTVTAKFNNANPNYFDVDNMTATLVITPTEATYTLPTVITGLKYTGNELELINPGIVSDGYFEYKYGSLDWSSNVPKGTNSGTYNVEYRLVLSGNYDEVEGGTIVVNISKATYDLSNIKFESASKVYNGSEQTINTITGTLPTGVSVEFVGSGKNVGEHTITAKFTGDTDNYELISDKTATLTITNATMTSVLVEGYNGKQDDELHQAVVSYSATTVDNSEITWKFSADGIHYVDASDLLVKLPSDSGTYYYKATALNHETVTGTFTVNVSDKDTPTLEITNLANLNKKYDGSSIIDPLVSTNSTGSYAITYSTDKVTYTTEKPINAGHYYIKVVLEETTSYAAKTIENTFDIAKADYELDVEFNNKTVTYNGSEQGITINGDLPEGVSVSYTGYATNAGTYTITAIFSHNNPNYNAISSITATLTIEKTDYELNIEFNSKTVTYNGEIQKLEITGELPEGITVSYENNNNKNVGAYDVIAVFSGDLINHNPIESKTAKLTIEKANYDLNIVFENTSKVYNGLTQTIEIEGTLPDTLSVSYTGGGVNVGSYPITATFTNNDSNYNDVSSITATLTITKATYNMTGVKLVDKVVDYNSSEQGIVITGTLPTGVTVSYTGYATNSGVHTITANFTGDSTNYELIPSMTAKLTINKIDPTYTIPSNLTAKVGDTLANVVLPEGFSFNDSLTTSVGNAGNNTFIVTYTPSDTTNFNIVDNIEVTILVKEAYVINATNNQVTTYNGNTQKPTVTVKLGSTTVTTGYDLSYSYKLSTASSYTTGLPKNAGTYNIKINCSGDAGLDATEVIVTYTINKAKLTLTSTTIEVDYSSSMRTWDQIQAKVASLITISGSFESLTYSLNGMYNGAYKYGTVSGSYSAINNSLFGSTYNYLVGSTYQGFITVNNSNYELDDYTLLIKYKTAMIGSTYYTIEDALEASGTTIVTFAGDSSSATSYVATIFSSLPTSLTGYKTTYTVSKNLLVPYTSGTGTTNGKVNNVNVSNTNTYTVLIINENITLNVSNLYVTAEISGCGYVGIHGTIVNNGIINCSSTLYSYGYIKGTGTINMTSGSKCYEAMCFYDYPGSVSNAQKIYGYVFPMYEWTVNSISCKLYIKKGAQLNAYACIYGTTAGYNLIDVTIIASSSSSSNYMFAPTSDSPSNSYVLLYCGQSLNSCNTSITANNQTAYKNITTIELSGIYNDNTVTVSKVLTFSTSTSIALPISYANIVIKSGSKLTLSKTSYIFTCGTKLEVEENATLEVNGSTFVAFDTYISNLGTSTIASTISGGKIINKDSAYMLLNGTLQGSGKIGGQIRTSKSNATIDLTNYRIPGKTIKYKTGSTTYSTYGDNYYISLIQYDGTTQGFGTSYTNALTYNFVSSEINGKYGWIETTSIITYETNCNKTVESASISMSASGYVLTSSVLPQVERDYYTFAGWYMDLSLTQSANNYTIYASTILYAKWTPINYNISYVDCYDNNFSSGNTSINANTTTFNIESNSQLIDPTNGVYVFGGWYLDSDCTNKINMLNGNNLVSYLSSNTLTLYALWYNVGTDKYVISFNNDNTNITCASTDTIIDTGYDWSSYNLPVMNTSDNDYTVTIYFGGWYNSNNEVVTSIDNSSFTYNDVTENYELVLTAKWIEKNRLDVTFLEETVVYYKPGFEFRIPSLADKGVTIGQLGLVLIDWEFNDGTKYTSGDKVKLTNQTSLVANIVHFVKLTISTNDYTTVTVTLTSGKGYIVTYNEETGESTATLFNGATKTNGSSTYITVGSEFAAKYEAKSGSESNSASITGTTPTTALTTSNQTYTATDSNITITPTGESSSCVALDTLITMADGSQKLVEDITIGDLVLTWNFFTGTYEVKPVIALEILRDRIVDVITVVLENGQTIDIISYQSFFDYDSKEYFLIDNKNYLSSIGRNIAIISNDGLSYSTIIDIIVTTTTTTTFEIITANNYNFIGNGILTVEPFIFNFNFFTVNENNTYDSEEVINDVNTYGLFAYEEFQEYMTLDEFNAFNGQYFKIAIAKGLTSLERIFEALTIYSNNYTN